MCMQKGARQKVSLRWQDLRLYNTYTEWLKIPPQENKLKIFGLDNRNSQIIIDAITLPFYLLFIVK